MKFSSLSLSPELHRAIAEMGYDEATEIQEKAIPVVLTGKDVIGQAQTGTGKTSAFGIPAIQGLQPHSINKGPQVLVLCPTRELAVQITGELTKLVKYMRGTMVLSIYGGQPINRQIMALRRSPQIVVGTPGRILDHLNRRTLRLDQAATVILDEADVMLDMGFRPDLDAIMKHTVTPKQVLLFSATMDPPILLMARKYQKQPIHIRTATKTLTVKDICQFYVEIGDRQKADVLGSILHNEQINTAMVFCNTKRMVDRLCKRLATDGLNVGALHGDMHQSLRDRTMLAFRTGKLDLLIATDVAARGIDVKAVDAVFNYDVPKNIEYYVHRIGRTGRAGLSGKAYTLVMRDDMNQLAAIQRYTRSRIQKLDQTSFAGT